MKLLKKSGILSQSIKVKDEKTGKQFIIEKGVEIVFDRSGKK